MAYKANNASSKHIYCAVKKIWSKIISGPAKAVRCMPSAYLSVLPNSAAELVAPYAAFREVVSEAHKRKSASVDAARLKQLLFSIK